MATETDLTSEETTDGQTINTMDEENKKTVVIKVIEEVLEVIAASEITIFNANQIITKVKDLVITTDEETIPTRIKKTKEINKEFLKNLGEKLICN